MAIADAQLEQPMLDGIGADVPVELGFRGPQVCSDRRHHLPPARLLGAHRPRPPVDRRRAGERHAAHATRTATSCGSRSSRASSTRASSCRPARKAIEYLREDLGDDWATASLVLDGTDSVLARTDDVLIDLVRQGQGVLNIVPLGHVMEELDAGVRRARRRASRVAEGG